jgi:hypothetical protein
MTSVDVSHRWANRDATLEILGISNAALILLRRDGVLEPDCVSCGRIRWLISELEERREEIRAYLVNRYGSLSESLLYYEQSDTIGVSK